MSSTTAGRTSGSDSPDSPGSPPDVASGHRPGPLGRLGVWVAEHAKPVTGAWLLLIIGLGAFAPQVEHNLSGAGWQADGSESVAARELARESFGGNASSAIQVVVHSSDGPVTEGDGADVLARATSSSSASNSAQRGWTPAPTPSPGTSSTTTRPWCPDPPSAAT